MLRVLMVCAAISIGIEVGFADPHERNHGNLRILTYDILAWIEGTAIFIAVFIVASVGSLNDYKKE
jgi:hypothetical protein